MIKAIRDINLLREPFKDNLTRFLKEMAYIGDPMAAHETLRSAERQLELLENNLSWVKVSNHQSGLAADLHFTTGIAFPAIDTGRWQKAAEIALKYDIDCGGLLWGMDWNHFQLQGLSDTEVITVEKDSPANNIYDSLSARERLQFNISQVYYQCGDKYSEVKELLHQINNKLRL